MQFSQFLLLLPEFCAWIRYSVPPYHAADGKRLQGLCGVQGLHSSGSRYHPGLSLPGPGGPNDIGHVGPSSEPEGPPGEGKGPGVCRLGPQQAVAELLHDPEGTAQYDLWVRKFQAYLAGAWFTIQTDHSALLDA